MANTKLIENEQGGVRRIGRYELIAEIASGGMATVFLARLSGVGGFQRSVAIKCLHPHLANNEEFVEMFLDEARLAALIHHPNVVPIQEVGEGEDGYYLVMDYVEGDTFAALLSKSAMDGKEVPRDISLRIVVDMLSGLHAAHELKDDHDIYVGLVHRDVSPQNILVGTDGVTRITDFGVARAASRLSATRAGQLKGKLAYMAPEQAGGEEEVDRRADVFSAGVVLWEALALRRLFKASNEAATLNRVLNDEIVSPREFSEDIPEPVAQVCLKALHRDLQTRYVSCAEFGDALEKAAASAGCLASGRDVATYVNEMVGSSIESHRRAIREWLERRASEPPTPASAIRAPLAPPPPPSRRSSTGIKNLGDTSAITRAGGRPSTTPLLSSRLGSQAVRPEPTRVVPAESLPPVPSIPVYPTANTMVSVPPELVANRKKKRWPLVAVAVALVGGAGAAAALLATGPEQVPTQAAGAAPGPTATREPGSDPATTGPTSTALPADSAAATAEERRKVLEADQLPTAGTGDEEGAATDQERPEDRTKVAPQPAPHPRRVVKRKKKKPSPDLENPYK